MRIVVVSCPTRAPLQMIWYRCFSEAWPDCPYPITMLSPTPDVGWNANLITCLHSLSDEFILLMLDDNYLAPSSEYSANIDRVLDIMRTNQDIALMKLQAGGAHAPELYFDQWERIREYDRVPHPFKRTNLIPAMYRRMWLLRLLNAVLEECGPEKDRGRQGAIEFEVTGTKLTEDARLWPERMFGIHRPGLGGSGGDSLLTCYANDAVTAGKIREELRYLCEGVNGAEIYL